MRYWIQGCQVRGVYCPRNPFGLKYWITGSPDGDYARSPIGYVRNWTAWQDNWIAGHAYTGVNDDRSVGTFKYWVFGGVDGWLLRKPQIHGDGASVSMIV